eukprot:c20721_g1_i2.p1 GENE.c20721_g1_i2~~c20721_g1_i2.p1  ORF type:complete len:377 (+),score=26.97 c20721_g1_i2:290-1420(+)
MRLLQASVIIAMLLGELTLLYTAANSVSTSTESTDGTSNAQSQNAKKNAAATCARNVFTSSVVFASFVIARVVAAFITVTKTYFSIRTSGVPLTLQPFFEPLSCPAYCLLKHRFIARLFCCNWCQSKETRSAIKFFSNEKRKDYELCDDLEDGNDEEVPEKNCCSTCCGPCCLACCVGMCNTPQKFINRHFKHESDEESSKESAAVPNTGAAVGNTYASNEEKLIALRSRMHWRMEVRRIAILQTVFLASLVIAYASSLSVRFFSVLYHIVSADRCNAMLSVVQIVTAMVARTILEMKDAESSLRSPDSGAKTGNQTDEAGTQSTAGSTDDVTGQSTAASTDDGTGQSTVASTEETSTCGEVSSKSASGSAESSCS